MQVALFTNVGAVEMPCEQSHMDTGDAIPSEVLSIAKFCGNLPLCVCVVAGMIRASKEDSSTLDSIREALCCLNDDKAVALSDEAAFSVSGLVAGRSVRSLPSENARLLFGTLGGCPKDAAIPFGFIVVLWASKQEAAQFATRTSLRMKSATKKLVSMLVLHNLLQPNTGHYTQHDIGKLEISIILR